MTDPRLLSLFSSVFILLGVYNVISGLRRMRDARRNNQPLVWYKQINLLTGIEYVLLALVFLLSFARNNGTLPGGLDGIIVPLYLLLLVAAAVLAGLVIRQGLSNARRLRARPSPQSVKSNGTSKTNQVVEADLVAAERPANIQRRRERRKNAAAARRRRAGKA